MRTPHTIEASRLQRQLDLDAAKSHAERNRLGQFATPPRLALEILRHSEGYFADGEKIRFLDPAFGTGAFFSALLQVVRPARIASARGFEIDAHYGEEAKKLWASASLKLHIRDFFAVPVPDKEQDKPNLMVCNPPYVRHHHLSGSHKARLGRLIAKTVGIRVNGLSGLYCYFLIYAHNWLVEEGIGCWLIPTEFMDVNYGAAVKDYLLRKVTLLRIHRFDPGGSQFDDALVSSAVVWFRKGPVPQDHRIEMTFGGSLERPDDRRTVSVAELSQRSKWTAVTDAGATKRTPEARLSDFFDVKRGLATGDNRFFILSEQEVERLGLPHKFLIPILPSPRYLKQDVIEADVRGNPTLKEQLFLLSCSLRPEDVKREYPLLWKYLESGKERKVHERYLCRHRSPWYAQENRPAPLFLCTYMGRHGSKKQNPFRFILNRSKATAANVYLLLYPKPPLSESIAEHPGCVREIWEGLTRISPELLVGEGRVYGGGLHKLEPRELANASADTILEAVPALRSRLASSGRLPALQERLF